MVSDKFKETIEKEMIEFAKQDEHFASKFNDEEKNIDDCCKYILNQVKKSGRNGFDDPEIFAMARHYYLEDISKDQFKDTPEIKVVVNHVPELTEEDKEKAKQKAIKEYENQIKQELKENEKKEKREKEVPKINTKSASKPKKKKEEVEPSYTIFDMLDE